ncbi:hypothetical protein LXL04_016177 [Taraxacum kok-saghyz]
MLCMDESSVRLATSRILSTHLRFHPFTHSLARQLTDRLPQFQGILDHTILNSSAGPTVFMPQNSQLQLSTMEISSPMENPFQMSPIETQLTTIRASYPSLQLLPLLHQLWRKTSSTFQILRNLKKSREKISLFFGFNVTEEQSQAGIIVRLTSATQSKFKLLYFEQDNGGGYNLAL